MARDPMARRFEKRKEKQKLGDLAKGARSREDIGADEELLKKTEKVEPIKAEGAPGRNEPCPCGSGNKYETCCGKRT